MNYADWLAEQTPERQAMSARLINASYLIGQANREGDWDMAKQYREEVASIYKEIRETDG